MQSSTFSRPANQSIRVSPAADQAGSERPSSSSRQCSSAMSERPEAEDPAVEDLRGARPEAVVDGTELGLDVDDVRHASRDHRQVAETFVDEQLPRASGALSHEGGLGAGLHLEAHDVLIEVRVASGELLD